MFKRIFWAGFILLNLFNLFIIYYPRVDSYTYKLALIQCKEVRYDLETRRQLLLDLDQDSIERISRGEIYETDMHLIESMAKILFDSIYQPPLKGEN